MTRNGTLLQDVYQLNEHLKVRKRPWIKRAAKNAGSCRGFHFRKFLLHACCLALTQETIILSYVQNMSAESEQSRI